MKFSPSPQEVCFLSPRRFSTLGDLLPLTMRSSTLEGLLPLPMRSSTLGGLLPLPMRSSTLGGLLLLPREVFYPRRSAPSPM